MAEVRSEPDSFQSKEREQSKRTGQIAEELVSPGKGVCVRKTGRHYPGAGTW